MVFHEELAAEMKRYFREVIGVDSMTENNLQQAYLPAGCTVFHNEWGTAPGCAFEAKGVRVIMLPGPPRECNAMFRACAAPYLRALSDGIILSHSLHIVGSGESMVEYRLREMMNGLTNPTLAPYAKEAEVMLRVTARAGSYEEAEKLIRPVIADVRGILGDIVYGVDADSLEQVVLELLLEKSLTLSTAESCTGGSIAKRMTDLKGSSAVFAGGAVTYVTESKTAVLGIAPEFIREYGVISGELAAEMAKQARLLFNSALAVSTTGLAGPDGDGVNPVGTVFVALASEDEIFVSRLNLGFGRTRVRMLASNCALDMVRRYLTKLTVTADYGKI
jgi:nicotinamide-nucleotide amidase